MVEARPLCGRPCRSRNHARQHLHTDHRKSAITDAYLAERCGGERPGDRAEGVRGDREAGGDEGESGPRPLGAR